MAEKYDIICPDCRVVLPRKDAPRVCPRCNKDVSNSYEILFRPGAQSTVAKRVAIAILAALAILVIMALASTMF